MTRTKKLVIISTLTIASAGTTFWLLRKDNSDVTFPLGYGAMAGVVGGIVSKDEVENYYKKIRRKS